jgi:hypothetical protein
MLIKKKHSLLLLLAEVVGSNPTRSISFILGKYGIILSLFWEVVGQDLPAATFLIPAIGTFSG